MMISTSIIGCGEKKAKVEFVTVDDSKVDSTKARKSLVLIFKLHAGYIFLIG